MDQRTVSPKEAARLLGIGKTSLYKLIKDRRVASALIGRRRLVLMKSIDAITHVDDEFCRDA